MGKKRIFMAKKEFKLRCKLIFSGDNLRWDLNNNGEIVLNKDFGKEEESGE